MMPAGDAEAARISPLPSFPGAQAGIPALAALAVFASDTPAFTGAEIGLAPPR